MQRKTPAWSPSLRGVVAAFRGGVAAARSVRIWERKKKDERKSGSYVRERQERETRTRTETEKNFGPDHSFTYPKNIVVQSKLWF
jgi:hypothetical protein